MSLLTTEVRFGVVPCCERCATTAPICSSHSCGSGAVPVQRCGGVGERSTQLLAVLFNPFLIVDESPHDLSFHKNFSLQNGVRNRAFLRDDGVLLLLFFILSSQPGQDDAFLLLQGHFLAVSLSLLRGSSVRGCAGPAHREVALQPQLCAPSVGRAGLRGQNNGYQHHRIFS